MDINDYLKAKKFAKNLITDEINYWNPIRAISQSFGINKLLQKSLLNAPLRTLEWLGYGKKRKNKKNNIYICQEKKQWDEIKKKVREL